MIRDDLKSIGALRVADGLILQAVDEMEAGRARPDLVQLAHAMATLDIAFNLSAEADDTVLDRIWLTLDEIAESLKVIARRLGAA